MKTTLQQGWGYKKSVEASHHDEKYLKGARRTHVGWFHSRCLQYKPLGKFEPLSWLAHHCEYLVLFTKSKFCMRGSPTKFLWGSLTFTDNLPLYKFSKAKIRLVQRLGRALEENKDGKQVSFTIFNRLTLHTIIHNYNDDHTSNNTP